MTDSTKQQDYRHRKNNQCLKDIPGDSGIPLLGNALPLVRDTLSFTRQRVAKYGPVSRIKLGLEQGLLVVGADNYKDIFLDKSKNFSAQMGYATQLGRYYEGGVLLHDFDEHKFQRRILQKAFKFSTMQAYVPTINAIVQQHLQGWPSGSQFEFYQHIKQALLQVGDTMLRGVDDYSDEAALLNRAFLNIADGLSAVLPWRYPGGKVSRALSGKKKLHDYVAGQIALRRAGDGDDMLSHMTRELNDHGQYFSDKEITQHTAFLLFAAHDTTTSALTHMIYYLGGNQHYQQQLREECQAIGKAPLQYQDLERLPELEMCFQEVLRLHPTVPILTRRTIEPCELSGVKIPPDTVLYMPTSYNQRDSRFWSNPDDFDPQRFNAERAEHKQHSYCYHPFGGGAHKCIGMHFAMMLSKCFMHQLLTQYRVETSPGYAPRMNWIPLPKPADGVPITLSAIGS